MLPKRQVGDLAVFGGEPAFREPLHVGRPEIGDRRALFARMERILDDRWLTNGGPLLREFEERVAERLGVRHCVATCNGTAALEMAMTLLGLTGEVIVPSFTFVATAHALRWRGLTPVFCDVDPRTHNLEPASVEKCIGERTTGILGVHVWGRPCPVEALAALARLHDLHLFYDAAHAFGTTCRGRTIGGFGRLEVLSFHATKILNTFEGGAIVTNDDDLANQARSMINFGFSDWDRTAGLGINAKMSEASAAMGLTGLESLDDVVAAHRRNYERYRERLADLPGLELVAYDERERSGYRHLVVEVDEAATGIGRDQLVEILHQENVLARRYFYPGCHRLEPYRTEAPRSDLPATEALCERVLSLPTGTAMSDGEIESVCDLLEFALSHATAVVDRLGAKPDEG
jgi:dTDP-4-amino-4,6-dideoxygalactose transaminase